MSRAWVAVAHGARSSAHILRAIGDPLSDSGFAEINAFYPHEKASDWSRSYLTAALEHLLMWADYAAPLKFHPDAEITHTFRPAYTLARAALEASSQAVWLQGGEMVKECARRHLSLIRWDYDEHRKSAIGDEAKARDSARDQELLARVATTFEPTDLPRPSYLSVVRGAASAVGREPEDLERIWRAASGAAHGKVWPSLDLQHVVPLDEYEPGHFRTLRIPDPDGMTEALEVAGQMTTHGVIRYADGSGYAGQIPQLIEDARDWLMSVIPIRDDADPEIPRCPGVEPPGEG